MGAEEGPKPEVLAEGKAIREQIKSFQKKQASGGAALPRDGAAKK
jgi:hypothetical protein